MSVSATCVRHGSVPSTHTFSHDTQQPRRHENTPRTHHIQHLRDGSESLHCEGKLLRRRELSENASQVQLHARLGKLIGNT